MAANTELRQSTRTLFNVDKQRFDQTSFDWYLFEPMLSSSDLRARWTPVTRKKRTPD